MGLVTDVILPIALAFIMFALGLGLTFEDFKRVATNPRDFLVGALSQIVLLPVVAFLLVNMWKLPPELALGVMIIAASPGGVTSNILTAFARGDVALSISLTAVISLLSVITIPIIVAFSYDQFMDIAGSPNVSVLNMAISICCIVTVPVILGLVVRQVAQNFAVRFERLARKISALLFTLVLAGAIIQERDNFFDYFAQAGLITLVLNVLMMVLAYSIAKIFASGLQQRIAISIECGLQNGTLAIAVATMSFNSSLAVVPAATYSLIMFATSLIFIVILRRKLRPEK